MIHLAGAALCAFLVIVGLALIYPPLALIATGIVLALLLFVDLERLRT